MEVTLVFVVMFFVGIMTAYPFELTQDVDLQKLDFQSVAPMIQEQLV